MNENELMHYGVKGMKWGVRRDARILMNHRYNSRVKQLQTQRSRGQLDYEKYVDELGKAERKKKKDLASVEEAFRIAKSDAERKKLGDNISKMAVKEVPDIKTKRGLAVVNQMFGVASVANTAYTSVALAAVNPAFGAAYLGAGAVTIAAEAGFRWVTRAILDNNS